MQSQAYISYVNTDWLVNHLPVGFMLTASPTSDKTILSSDTTTYKSDDIEQQLSLEYPKVYRFVAAMTWGSGLDPEDITQEVFLKAFRSASGFNRDSSLSTWLYRIARNTVLDALRRRKVRSLFSLTWPTLSDGTPEDIADTISASAEMDAREMQDVVRGAIAALDEPYRSLVIWREIEEMPYRDIAEITGESEGTLKSRLFYAKRKLRDILIAKGVTYESE